MLTLLYNNNIHFASFTHMSLPPIIFGFKQCLKPNKPTPIEFQPYFFFNKEDILEEKQITIGLRGITTYFVTYYVKVFN